MRRALVALLIVLSSAFVWSERHAFSEEGKEGKEGGGLPSEEEMQKLMEELGKVGPQHKWLAGAEGTWDVTVKQYGQDGKVEESKATSTFRMILGGRWQEQVYNGTYKGQPFEGRGLTGYDNAKKAFVNYWLDGMSTGASEATGQASADGKSLTFTGSWDMPSGKMDFRMLLTQVSATQMTFAMTGSAGGHEFPMLDMVYMKK